MALFNKFGVANRNGDAQVLRPLRVLGQTFAGLGLGGGVYCEGLESPVARRWFERRCRALGIRASELGRCDNAGQTDAAIAFLHALFEFPERRLAVYGTLVPGRQNYHLVQPLGGVWSVGRVAGSLLPEGWGVTHGYAGMRWEPGASGSVEVHVLCSRKLPAAWGWLDEFEGADYRRIWVPVDSEQGVTVANLYAVA